MFDGGLGVLVVLSDDEKGWKTRGPPFKRRAGVEFHATVTFNFLREERVKVTCIRVKKLLL